MEKSLFTILLVFLGVGVIFGGYRFFQDDQNQLEIANLDTIDVKRIPLGDGKISLTPRKGYIMSCQSTFGGRGAFRAGEWIRSDGTWDSTAKIEVDGDVAWDNFKYEIKIEDGKRKLIGNGLPNHNTGSFPIQSNDDAFQYDRNPNRINEIQVSFNLPLMPQIAASPSCISMGAIGVMKTGVAIFNGLDAQGKDAVAHEIQDKCNGHPERQGQYHYHNLSKCIEEKSGQHSELVGYALDGFGIFGAYGEGGKQLTNNDLDECHGHIHDIMWDGNLVNMFHYHSTKEYPYTIGCFKGNPIISKNRPPFGRPPLPF